MSSIIMAWTTKIKGDSSPKTTDSISCNYVEQFSVWYLVSSGLHCSTCKRFLQVLFWEAKKLLYAWKVINKKLSKST